MSQINEAIKKAVSENLTGVVAAELQEYLKKAEAAFVQLERANANIALLNSEVDSLKSRIRSQETLDDQCRALVRDQEALLQKELAFMRKEARYDADVTASELKGYKDSASMFLRNTIVRESVFESNNTVVPPNHPGGYPTTMPTSNTSTVTKTTSPD